MTNEGFPGGLVVKNPPVNAGNVRDKGSIPEWGRFAGEGNSNPLKYSCLDSPTDRGAWQVTIHEVARVGHDLANIPPPQWLMNIFSCVYLLISSSVKFQFKHVADFLIR